MKTTPRLAALAAALLVSASLTPAQAQDLKPSPKHELRRYAVYRADTREFSLDAPGKLIGLTDGAAPGFVDANAGAGKS